MYHLLRTFILTVFLFAGTTEAQLVDIPPSKQMLDGLCVDTQGEESAARDVDSGPDTDSAYLQKIPSCRNQVTCLSRERLEYLERVGMMPMGLKNPQEYFKAAAPLAVRMSCYEDQAKVEHKVLELDDILKKTKKLMPYETMLSMEITLGLAQRGREFIKDNRAAVQVLADCYQLDAEYDERSDLQREYDKAKRDAKKLSLYRTSDLRKRSEAPICERLWNGTENISGTLKNLTELRQTLLMWRLRVSGSLSAEEFDIFVHAFSVGFVPDSEDDRTILPMNKVILAPNPLYADAPKVLAPANDYEIRGLLKLNRKIARRYPNVSLEEALLSNINRLIVSDPMLIYFDKPRPTSADMAKAFKQYAANLKTESFEDGLSDFQFYDYPKLVDSLVKEYPPDMRGDACAVAEYVHRRSREIAELPATMLMDVTTVAGLGGALNIPVLLKMSGATAAKGAAARAGAFLSSGMVPGMALMADIAVTRGLSIKFEKDMCQSLQGKTNEMCRPKKIGRDLIELQIMGVMMAAMPVVMKATSSFGAARAAKAAQAEAVQSAPANTFRRHKSERKR